MTGEGRQYFHISCRWLPSMHYAHSSPVRSDLSGVTLQKTEKESAAKPWHVFRPLKTRALILTLTPILYLLPMSMHKYLFYRRQCLTKHTINCLPQFVYILVCHCTVSNLHCKSKGVPQQAEVALGVSGRLRPQIISTFGTTRVVGRQPYAPAAFTPGEIPGTHFQRLSRPQGTWFCRKEPRKKSRVTPPGIDPGTVLLVAQRLNHYATPGPIYI